jgi:hypothetical protein
MPQAFFFPFSQCLQADQLLASPVTECRAQNLHYSLASFVTGTKALDLQSLTKILQSVTNKTLPAWSKVTDSFRYSPLPQWILAVRRRYYFHKFVPLAIITFSAKNFINGSSNSNSSVPSFE